MSAEDQPQRPRISARNRWNPSRPRRSTCCGWCAAHTAALREKSSRRTRNLQGCSTGRRGRNQRGARGAARGMKTLTASAVRTRCALPPLPSLRSFRSRRCFQETLRSWWRGVEHRRDRKERREGRSRWRCPTLARRRPACRAGRSGSRARPSWAGEFGAKEWKGTKWWRAELAGRATVISSRRARILKSCSTARQSRNPRRAAVSAEAQPQRPGIRAGTGCFQRRPLAATGCSWCSAPTAALWEKSSQRARILPSCSTEKTGAGVGAKKSPISDRISASEFLVFSVFIVPLWSLRIGSTEKLRPRSQTEKSVRVAPATGRCRLATNPADG